MKSEKKRYFTVKEIMDAVMEQAKADPMYQDAEKRCELDYDITSCMTEKETLELCSFDVIGHVAYGGSEGIYGGIELVGAWKHSQEEAHTFHCRMNVYTLKTLETSKDAYLAMGELVTLICYYANEYVGAHLDRFD